MNEHEKSLPCLLGRTVRGGPAAALSNCQDASILQQDDVNSDTSKCRSRANSDVHAQEVNSDTSKATSEVYAVTVELVQAKTEDVQVQAGHVVDTHAHGKTAQQAPGMVQSNVSIQPSPAAANAVYLSPDELALNGFCLYLSLRAKAAPCPPVEQAAITCFHCPRHPMNFDQYIVRIVNAVDCSPSCYVAALAYMNLLIRDHKIPLNLMTCHRLFMTCVSLAIKVYEDELFAPNYYVLAFGITGQELADLELALSRSIDWKFHVSPEEFDSIRRYLCHFAIQHGVMRR